jgi:probable phosphoglycerate mutase
MRLYLIRHADPDYPNHTITPLGHTEASALAQHFSRTAGLTHLYTSPLPRAVHTMQYTQEATGLPCTTLDWTAELGEFRLADQPPDCQMAWDYPGHHLRNHPGQRDDWFTHPPFHTPEYAATWNRIREGSDRLLAAHGYIREGHHYRIARRTADRVAVFCHGGLGLTWLAHLLHLPVPLVWSGFWFTPTGVTTILMDERTPDTTTPRVLHHNNTAHLALASLPPNPHGIKANFE